MAQKVNTPQTPVRAALAEDPRALSLALDELHRITEHCDRPVQEVWEKLRLKYHPAAKAGSDSTRP